jgi:hypothetical protein
MYATPTPNFIPADLPTDAKLNAEAQKLHDEFTAAWRRWHVRATGFYFLVAEGKKG